MDKKFLKAEICDTLDSDRGYDNEALADKILMLIDLHVRKPKTDSNGLCYQIFVDNHWQKDFDNYELAQDYIYTTLKGVGGKIEIRKLRP